jgi:hypothetical protein
VSDIRRYIRCGPLRMLLVASVAPPRRSLRRRSSRSSAPFTPGGHMAKLPEPAAEVMGADAKPSCRSGRAPIGQSASHLARRRPLSQHDCATSIQANDVERVLPDIDTGDCDCSLLRVCRERAPIASALQRTADEPRARPDHPGQRRSSRIGANACAMSLRLV